MSYKDLREFISQVDGLGVLRRVSGADPHFEIGAITEVAAGMPECPALLFDDIKGFARGFRVFSNATTTPQRAALALGLVNTIIRPVLVLLTLPVTVLTLGLFVFVINGLLFWAVGSLVPGFHVAGFWSAVLGAIVFSLLSWLLSSLAVR